MLRTDLKLAMMPFFLCLVGSLSPCEAQTATTTQAVEDNSQTGSPLTVSGTIVLQETKRGARVRIGITEDISIRNISGKTILTFVAWLDVVPSRGSAERFVRQYECFFAPDVIKPGDIHAISEPHSETEEPFNPHDPPEIPRAELRIVFVQFLDGSVFGNEFLGEEILSARREAWQVMERLNRTFVRSGEGAFVEELFAPREPGPIDGLLANVRQTQRQLGTRSAVGQIRRMLDFAEERTAGFQATN